MFTRDEILALNNGFFCIRSLAGGDPICYRVDYMPRRGRFGERWFLHHAMPHESRYVGTINDFTGEVELTQASKYPIGHVVVQLAGDVLTAVFQGRRNQLAGFYKGWIGTPGREPADPAPVVPLPVPVQPVAPPVLPPPPRPAPTTSDHTTVDRCNVKIGQLLDFDYDIPDRSPFKMDYSIIRRRMVRRSKSCYMIREDLVPWPMLDEMTKAGVTWNLTKFDVSETEALLKRGEQQTNEALRQAIAALSSSLHDAEEDYNADLTIEQPNPEKARKRYENRVALAFKRAELLAKDYGEAVKNYPMGIDLHGLRSATESMRSLAAARAAVYAQNATKLTGTTYAQAASNGEIPAGVMADMIEDEGGDGSELRGAFYDLETGGEV